MIEIMDKQIDINERCLMNLNKDLLAILLKDRTTKKNIIWATDNYRRYGESYQSCNQIMEYQVVCRNGQIIKPRVVKTKKEQQDRVRSKAEVFTPSWICNKQNNLIDDAWFGREGLFNKETEKGWTTTKSVITFDGCVKDWQDYVKDTRLEISCGEAPYLTSRYDTVTGQSIEVSDRIGLLDRKLRIVSENVNEKAEWLNWAIIALKNIYGYDWQGDNVLLARENLIYTFMDFYTIKFNEELPSDTLLKVAEIISWNIWQMDGLKFVIPNSCKTEKKIDYTLFGEEITEEICEGCKRNNSHKHNGIYCKIKDWDKNRVTKFVTLLSKGV